VANFLAEDFEMALRDKLINERVALRNEAAGIVAAGETANGLSADQEARLDVIHAEIERVDASLARIKRQDDLQREAPAVQRVETGVTAVRDRIEDDPMRGFNGVAEFALAVRSASRPGGQVDERLHYMGAPTNFHRETGSDEGYMVPPQMSERIWEVAFEEDSLLAEVDNEPTSRNAVDKIRDDSTPWGASGVKAYWRAEGAQMNASKLETEKDLVRLGELYAFVLATEELREDAPRLEDRLTRKSGQAIRWKSNQAIFEGDGVGKPLGWMKSAALVTQAKESAQAAATIVAGNVAKMYSRVIDPARAIWFVNQDAFPQLMTMTLGNQPIWTSPQSGLVNAPGGLLLGRPVRFAEHCETLGTAGDIQLVSPLGYYAVTKRNNPTFAASMHLFFDYNMEAYRWTFRLGGQPHLSAPISPAKGSTTRSHFVTLAVRN